MPTILLIYRQRSEEFLPRDRVFRLRGWIGWIVNIWVIVMISSLMIFFFLPPFLPVSASTMSKFIADTPVHIFRKDRKKKKKEKQTDVCKTIIVL